MDMRKKYGDADTFDEMVTLTEALELLDIDLAK